MSDSDVVAIGHVDGISVVIRLRLSGEQELRLLVEAVESERTKDLDKRYESRITEYNDRVQALGLEKAGAPPSFPGLLLLKISPRTSDVWIGAGHHSIAAGTGSEWEAKWIWKSNELGGSPPLPTSLLIFLDEGPLILAAGN